MQQIETVIQQAGGRWHIVFQAVGGDPLYTRQPDDRITIASVVKVPIAMLAFISFEAWGIPENELAAFIAETGPGGRTYAQLLSAMLVKSEEDATEKLFAVVKESINYRAELASWEIGNLDLEARRFTARGVADLWEALYAGALISPTARGLILDDLSAYTPSDETRIAALTPQLPPGWQIYNKRGSLLSPYVVADSAVIENPEGTDYILVIFAYQGEPETTYEALDEAVADIAEIFWGYIASTPENR